MLSAGLCCCLLSKSRQDLWQQLAVGIITGYDDDEQRLWHLSEAVVKWGRKTLLFNIDVVESAAVLGLEAAHQPTGHGDSICPGLCP